MARLFNAYVMVDWSAASSEKPNTGPNSIWIGVIKRDTRFRPTFEAHNPPTRQAAEVLLRSTLADLARKGDRALVGFDFPLGYPQGTAAALKLKGEHPWSAIWKYLGSNVVDPAGKMNNRATVAARMNRLITDGPRPFWGAPRAADATTHLSKTKPSDHNGDLPEFRRAEIATKGKGKQGAKSVWQLTGNGSVGSQALVGIPFLKRLKDELGDKFAVWPFETGWKAITEHDLAGKEALVAEIYPSLAEITRGPEESLDAAQVRTLCEHFARLDADGKLGAAFAPPKGVSDDEVQVVQQEEGWILS